VELKKEEEEFKNMSPSAGLWKSERKKERDAKNETSAWFETSKFEGHEEKRREAF
jgi:hypothetical protein